MRYSISDIKNNVARKTVVAIVAVPFVIVCAVLTAFEAIVRDWTWYVFGLRGAWRGEAAY